MRPSPAHALACALLFPAAAEARTFTPSDLVKLEAMGGVSLAPGGRWAVVQTFRPWDEAPAYDLDWWTLYGLGRLQRVDLRDGAARPLLKEEAGCGYIAGPISPSGARMTVSRLCGHAWEVGVVDIADGATHWLGIAPEIAMWGREIAWRSDDELLVIAQSEAPVGQRLGFGWQGAERLNKAWARAAAGEVSVTALGSGRYRNLRARATPKRLLRIAVPSGQPTPLAGGDLIDLELSPDGRWVAVVSAGEDIQDDEGGRTTTGTAGFRRRLTLIDLTTGLAAAPCPTCDVMPDLLSWSPRGDRLLIYARTAGPWPGGGYQLVDARLGAVTPVHAAGLDVVLPRSRDNGDSPAAAWMSETPVILARPSGPSGRADWYAMTPEGPRNLTRALANPGRRIVARSGDGLVIADGPALWRISAHDQARRLDATLDQVIDAGPDVEAERLATTPATTDRLLLRKGGSLRAFDPHVRGRLPIAEGERPLAAAPDLASAIVDATDPHGAERLRLRRDGRPDIDLLTLNGGLDGVEPAKVQAIHHRGADGKPLTSWLYLPPGLAADAKAPLIVSPYPGDALSAPPASQGPGSRRLFVNAQVLAGAGYAVLLPSLPFVEGREPVDGLADQVLAIVDAAADQAPVDTTRLALWGHSYGGYAALALATQSARFKAVVAGAAASNLTSIYAVLTPYCYAVPEGACSAMGSSGWAESGQARMNAPPWRDPERYWRNSPISHVDRITTPLMLIVGDQDKDPTQSEQMFTSLYRQDKDAVLLLYHGESHVISSPGNVLDQYARALAFLNDHIGPPVRLGPGGP